MSMAAGGENGSRDMGEKLNKKGKATPVVETLSSFRKKIK